MKIVQVDYVNPKGEPIKEVFDCAKCKVVTDHGFLKFQFDGIGTTRIIPFHRVLLVDYGETEETPRLVLPQA